MKEYADRDWESARNLSADFINRKDLTGKIGVGNDFRTAEEFRNMSPEYRKKFLDKLEKNKYKVLKEESKLSNLGKYADETEQEFISNLKDRNKMLKIAGGVGAGVGLASARLSYLHYKNKNKKD